MSCLKSHPRETPQSPYGDSSPFKGALIAPTMPFLSGEVPAAQVEGFANADLGRFNLWRPMIVDRTGGSKRLSSLPTVDRTGGSMWPSALPTGNAGMSFPGVPGKPQTSGASIYGP